jgi:hypothetical protein
MDTKIIVGLVAILVIAAAAYMFASGNIPSAAPSTQATADTSTAVTNSVEEAAATSAATDAESAVGGTADEISSANALEIPDV